MERNSRAAAGQIASKKQKAKKAPPWGAGFLFALFSHNSINILEKACQTTKNML
jgi:hypothetical protein